MIEEMTKIRYTAFESQKNYSCVQFKMDDIFNCMCPELNTISDSNQPQKGDSLDENGVVE